MSRELTEFRDVQFDIRLLSQSLRSLNEEEQVHPARKFQDKGTLAQQAEWETAKALFARRRTALRRQLDAKRHQQNVLHQKLSQEPVSMVSLAFILDRLTKIEGAFAVDGTREAWDETSELIDTLTKDEERVLKLRAVKAA